MSFPSIQRTVFALLSAISLSMFSYFCYLIATCQAIYLFVLLQIHIMAHPSQFCSQFRRIWQLCVSPLPLQDLLFLARHSGPFSSLEGLQSLPLLWKALRTFPFCGRLSEPSPFFEGLQSLPLSWKAFRAFPALKGLRSLPSVEGPQSLPFSWKALRAFPFLGRTS